MSGHVPLHSLMMVATGMWIARRELATRLGAVLGKQVQILDCDSDLEDLTHYQVLNLVRRPDCLDWQNSEVQTEGRSRRVRCVGRLGIDDAKVKRDTEIFRPK